MLSTQVDISLEKYLADSMQQMLKVHRLLLFYCSRVAKSYLLKLIGQGNWHLEDKQVRYTLSCPHSTSDSGASRSTVPAAGAGGSCLLASGMWRSRTPHSQVAGLAFSWAPDLHPEPHVLPSALWIQTNFQKLQNVERHLAGGPRAGALACMRIGFQFCLSTISL